MLRHSIKQFMRTPIKTVSFILLITAFSMFFTLGVLLWMINQSTIHNYQDSFVTIGTVEQKAFSINKITRWSAQLKDYELRQSAVYSKMLPVSTLLFEGANYIEKPEKRSYYGSYAPDYTLVSKENSAEVSTVVAEISPMEDCVPDESVLVKINKIWGGSSNLEGAVVWFCNHYVKNPEMLEKEKSYALILNITEWTHGTHYDEAVINGQRNLEYTPSSIASCQYEANGTLMMDTLEESKEEYPYYEVTEGFYDTAVGKRLLEIAKGVNLTKHTMPMTGTNATILLMPFYKGDAYISQGRDILPEEYEEGKKVCLVSSKFAKNNNLMLDSQIHTQLYYTNSRKSAGISFKLDGGGGGNWPLIDAKGEAFKVFEDSWYTIVGIYDIASGASQDNYSMGGDEVIVPANSIHNKDKNIIEYGPMKGYTTSFQIPNGSIETFMAAWEQFGTEELEITFYDMGYSQIKSGLENMKRISFILLTVGILMVFFLIFFYSHLFVTNQRLRTAIERCLGMEKRQCRFSLLSGMLLLLMIGSAIGCTLGGALSQYISANKMNLIYYDASFSSLAEIEVKNAVQSIGGNIEVVIISTILCFLVITFLGLVITNYKINSNLKLEPMRLLNKKE